MKSYVWAFVFAMLIVLAGMSLKSTAKIGGAPLPPGGTTTGIGGAPLPPGGVS